MARNLRDAFSEAGIAPPPPERKTPKPTEDSSSVPADQGPTAPPQATLAAKAGKRPIAPMPIGVDEIEPGIVARLDPAVLIEDSRVCHTQDPPVSRAGLFVCVEAEGDISTWAGLTTGGRRERLPIKPEWRSGAYKRWRFAAQFLTDGASVWRGPKEAFAAASWQEVSASGGRNRGRLSEEGLAAVRQEIEAQRHRRHRSCR